MNASRILAGAALFASMSVAQAGGYWGLSLSQTEFDVDDIETHSFALQDDAFGATLHMGYNFNDWLAVEGRLGATSDTKDGSGNLDGVKAKHYEMGLVKVSAPLRGGDIKLYAAGGFTTAAIKAGPLDDTLSGASYGLGVDFTIGESSRFGIEWMHHFDEKRRDANVSPLELEYEMESISFIYMKSF